MSRIAYFDDKCYMDFDNHCFYDNSTTCQIEIKGREFQVLEYLCKYPDCYKSTMDINNYLDDGCLSNNTVRGYIHKLKNLHPVISKTIVSSRNIGYKYIGSRIIESQSSVQEDTSNEFITISKALEIISENIDELLKSIIYCDCKWGSCTYDEVPQNTNTCEGLLALLLSHREQTYNDIVLETMSMLLDKASSIGLKSLSLDYETVVPTGMFLYLANLANDYAPIKNNSTFINKIALNMWENHSNNGWGIYVDKMERYCNIGCTFWGVLGLLSSTNIERETICNFICSLFRYDNTYSYGQYIDDVNPRIPSIYSTSMMLILYFLLDTEYKEKIGTKFNYKKSLDYIIQNFNNPFYMVEQEGLHGIDTTSKTSVHTVNWNHISIHYSLYAISLAYNNNLIDNSQIKDILSKIIKIIDDNCEIISGRKYWHDPKMTLENGKRGYFIFPTMHFVMGLSRIVDTLR